MTLIEPNLYRTWLAKQAVKGTGIATTAMTKSPRMVGGSVVTNFDIGSENFSDGTQFGGVAQWINSVAGAGAPVLLGGSDILAYVLWLFHGGETVSPSGTNEVKTATVSGVPTSGTFRYVYEGQQTAPIAYNANAAAQQAALTALSSIGAGNLVAAGGPFPGTPVTFTFQGALAKRPIGPLTAVTSFDTGGLGVALTTPGVLATHTFTPTGAPGFWLTWAQTIGQSSKLQHKYNDGKIGGVTIAASTEAKGLHVTPNLLFLDPAETYATDPTPTLDGSPNLLYTEGNGAFTFDGVVVNGQTSFEITLNLDLSLLYGDNSLPHDLERGNAGATIAANVIMDDVALARWNSWVYGDDTPSVGAKPIRRLPSAGSYSALLSKLTPTSLETYASLSADFPSVQWAIPDSPGPAPGSGSTSLALTGRMLTTPGVTPYTLAVGCQQAAFTV